MGKPYYCIFLVLLLLFVSQHISAANPADLQSALDDMRSSSYHGFVILLQMLNSKPNSLQDGEMTFLMPSDAELSNSVITPETLHEFVLSHSVPTTLLLDDLVHLPSGTVLPSSYPNRTISLTGKGRLNFFLNNAKIVKANVCSSSSIKCHGVTNVIKFGSGADSPPSGADSPPSDADEEDSPPTEIPVPTPAAQKQKLRRSLP